MGFFYAALLLSTKHDNCFVGLLAELKNKVRAIIALMI